MLNPPGIFPARCLSPFSTVPQCRRPTMGRGPDLLGFAAQGRWRAVGIGGIMAVFLLAHALGSTGWTWPA